MVKVLVWVLVLNSSSGGLVVYDNLASLESCERLLQRSTSATNRRDGHSYVSGACTQVEKFVPATSVSPSETKVTATQVQPIKEKK